MKTISISILLSIALLSVGACVDDSVDLTVRWTLRGTTDATQCQEERIASWNVALNYFEGRSSLSEGTLTGYFVEMPCETADWETGIEFFGIPEQEYFLTLTGRDAQGCTVLWRRFQRDGNSNFVPETREEIELDLSATDMTDRCSR